MEICALHFNWSEPKKKSFQILTETKHQWSHEREKMTKKGPNLPCEDFLVEFVQWSGDSVQDVSWECLSFDADLCAAKKKCVEYPCVNDHFKI